MPHAIKFDNPLATNSAKRSGAANSLGRLAVAAGILTVFITAGGAVQVGKDFVAARTLITAMSADEGVPQNLVTAMKADEGVPHNLVTAMKADEGVPHNMVTAMNADEHVPHYLLAALTSDEGVPHDLLTA